MRSGRSASRGSLSGKRVLLVEDNDLNMEIAEFYLDTPRRRGQSMERQGSSPNVRKLEAGHDLADLDGLDDARHGRLRGHPLHRALDHPDASTVPIIAMTATPSTRIARIERRMNAHLAKPLDMQALLSAAGRFCR